MRQQGVKAGFSSHGIIAVQVTPYVLLSIYSRFLPFRHKPIDPLPIGYLYIGT